MSVLSRLKEIGDNTNIKNEIKFFEKESNIILPPIFKVFIENFEILNIDVYVNEHVLIDRTNRKLEFETWNFQQDSEIGIEAMISPKEYIDAKLNVYDAYEEDESFIKDKVIFGNIFGGVILVAVAGPDKESIHVDFIADEKRYFKVADNIFDLFRQSEININEQFFINSKLKVENLYKNYGEDFWRIRKDDNT